VAQVVLAVTSRSWTRRCRGWREGQARQRKKEEGEEEEDWWDPQGVKCSFHALKLNRMSYALTNFDCIAYKYWEFFHNKYVTGAFLMDRSPQTQRTRSRTRLCTRVETET
jgi:hypothetical protein